MQNYTIYKCAAKDSVQTEPWSIYFKTVSYEEGIRFLQSMDTVVNAKFTMLKTIPRAIEEIPRTKAK